MKHHYKIKNGMLYGAGTIPKSDEIYLLLSEESYKPKNERDQNVMGYLYDVSLSTERTAVYVGKGITIIANRGTIPTDKSDLIQDALILSGHFDKSDRLKRTLQVINETIKKYPNNKIVNTGHSLGGRVASELGKILDIKDSKVVAFNVGSSPVDVAKNLLNRGACLLSNSEKCKKEKNQTLYSTGIDPISLASLSHHGSVLIKPETVNVHSLSNFKI